MFHYGGVTMYDVDIARFAPGFYIHGNSIRYFHRNLAPCTLTPERPFIMEHGVFSFGSIVNDGGLVAFANGTGPGRALHLYGGYIVSGMFHNGFLHQVRNPQSCWGMENGIPKHDFAPQLLNEKDSYQVLLDGFKMIDRDLLDPPEWKHLLDTERDIEAMLAYLGDDQPTKPELTYAEADEFLQNLIIKYRRCLFS